MKNDIARIIIKCRDNEISLDEASELILSLLDENTESVSGSSQESGVSHAVRDRNANGGDSPKELEPVAEALEIRTDSEKSCQCKKPMFGRYVKGITYCYLCNGILDEGKD